MESKEYGDFAKSLEDELMNYTNDEIHGNPSGSGARGPTEAEHSDATECSSSFEGSESESGGVDEAEVVSDFGGADKSFFTERRKLSSQWRAFIHPLMWRCKWAELQMKKLKEQAHVYGRKLEGYNRGNVMQSGKSASGVVWRKRRRRDEAANDVASYMSRHNLFSYYEHRRYIKEIAHNVVKNHDAREGGKSDVESGNEEAGDCDKELEATLQKLEALHSRVVKLKSRVGKLVVEEEDDPSSPVSLNSPPTPSTEHRVSAGTYIASQLLADYNLGGVLLPGGTGPSRGEVAPRSTGQIHSGLTITAHAYQIEDEDGDDVLIDNHRVSEELRYFEEVKTHSVERPWIMVRHFAGTSHSHMEPPQPPRAQARSNLNLTNAARSNAHNKRGRRK